MLGQVWYERRMLTRSQVARRIGRSVATVRRMEGTSLHPEIGPRGIRLFDVDELEDVAARIARSGRALGRDTFAHDRPRPDRQSRSYSDAASGEVSRLKELLAKTRETHAAWRARVEDAVEIVVAAATEDDVLLALEDLVEVLRSNDDAR
jgi:hypothetical protein